MIYGVMILRIKVGLAGLLEVSHSNPFIKCLAASKTWTSLLKSWRNAAWDVESQLPCDETIAYSIAKTRFAFHENREPADPFVHHLLDMSNCEKPSYVEQTAFIDGVHFVEFLQDIMVYQRLEQLGKLKMIRHRKYNGKRLKIRGINKVMNEIVKDGTEGKYLYRRTVQL